MLASAWPEHEIFPAEERLLVQQAHLRPFGTNYLQGAICPELELLAHPDGSRVLLLPLSTTLPCETGACAATIDPQPPPRENLPREETSKRSRGPSSLLGPVRGLAWSTRRLPQPSNDLAGAKDVEVGSQPCFLAVTWGCEVRVWQVSRPSQGNYSAFEVGTDWGKVGSSLAAPKANGARNPSVPSGDGGGGSAPPSASSTKVGSTGAPEDVLIQPAEDKGAEDHRGLATAPGEFKEESKPGSVGIGSTNILSVTFAPATRTCGMTTQGDRGEDEVPNKEASPLAAWHPGGVTILRAGGKLMTLPAPVMKKRTCGSWSGCGKRLAVSSGGEIRIYTPFLVKPTVQGCRASDEPQGEEPPETRELSTPTAHPVVAVSSQDATSATTATNSEETCPPVHEVGDFLTVLCVEAILQGGTSVAGLRCPDAAVRGRLSSLSVSRDSSPVSRRTSPSSLSPGRPADARGTVGSPSSRATPGDNDHYKRSEADSRTCYALPSRSLAGHPSLIGDMRAMCPGGREAFFGTTDGGLGLGSSGGVTTVGDILNSGADSDTGVGLISRKKGPMALDDLLEGLNATRSLADSDARGAANNAVEKVDRVQGFRHVLPGDSWLGNSLRSPVRPRLTASSDTRAEPADRAASEITRALNEVDVSRVSAASSGRSSRPNPLSLMSIVHGAGTRSPGPVSCSCSPQPAYSLEGSPSPPSSPASSEVLDLRGKLGRDGNPESMNTSRVHPLFRLSLGSDPDAQPPITPQKAQQDNLLGNPAGGGAERNARREPLLLRVATIDSCRRSGGQGGDAQAVEIDAIACLPRALSSPDLVAASEDGRLVAVGSHACGLVACYHMVPQQNDAALVRSARGSTATSTVDEGQARTELASGDTKVSDSGSGLNPAVSSPHQNRSKIARRRAKAVCTLRLPEGHRAKGLSFIDTGNAPSATTSAPRDDLDAKTVSSSLLVLAAAPGRDGAFSRVRPSRATAGGSGEGNSMSTVLLHFLLPRLAELKVVPPAASETTVSESRKVAAATADRVTLGTRRSTDLAGERFAQQEALRVAEVESLEREGSFRLAGSESPVSQEGLVIRGHPAAWAYPVSPQNGNLSPFLVERGVSDGRSGSPMSGVAIGSSLHALGRRSSENSGKSLQGGAMGGRFHVGTGNEQEERVNSKRRGAPIRRETSGEDLVDKFGGRMGQGDGLMVIEALERMEGRMNARFDGIERMLSGMHERLCSVEQALTNTRLT